MQNFARVHLLALLVTGCGANTSRDQHGSGSEDDSVVLEAPSEGLAQGNDVPVTGESVPDFEDLSKAPPAPKGTVASYSCQDRFLTVSLAVNGIVRSTLKAGVADAKQCLRAKTLLDPWSRITATSLVHFCDGKRLERLRLGIGGAVTKESGVDQKSVEICEAEAARLDKRTTVAYSCDTRHFTFKVAVNAKVLSTKTLHLGNEKQCHLVRDLLDPSWTVITQDSVVSVCDGPRLQRYKITTTGAIKQIEIATKASVDACNALLPDLNSVVPPRL